VECDVGSVENNSDDGNNRMIMINDK